MTSRRHPASKRIAAELPRISPLNTRTAPSPCGRARGCRSRAGASPQSTSRAGCCTCASRTHGSLVEDAWAPPSRRWGHHAQTPPPMPRGRAARRGRGATLLVATGSRHNARGGREATRGSRAACSAPPARGCAAGARRGATEGPPVAPRAVAGSPCAWRARQGSRKRRLPHALRASAGSRGSLTSAARRLMAFAPLRSLAAAPGAPPEERLAAVTLGQRRYATEAFAVRGPTHAKFSCAVASRPVL